ncbi:MAG TPA: efflux RND transporter permease subunit, partial [Pseudomonadales bacterium]|nr:efflux RND transporter permease subunit [Pseudomonadales bacterium]
GVVYTIPYDTSKFVRISIEEVVKTLFEAILLVFLVMYLFLQNWRVTLIPTLVVPVALMGAFTGMSVFGYSINVLTMFGLVLAIGILVDDAIVVVENVERIMAEEGLSPREATRKAMQQISGAIIGITLVLVAVFIPMAFFGGSVGAIYRQFSLALVVTILFSAMLALTLTPALCSTLLRPHKVQPHERKGFFGWFNRLFTLTTNAYTHRVASLIKHSFRYLVIYFVIIGVVGWLITRLPTAFLPDEDQGYLINIIQLPPGATQERTLQVLQTVENHYLKEDSAASAVVAIAGFSFFGNGQNAAVAFTALKPWDERKSPDQHVLAVIKRAFMQFSQIKDAIVFPLNPPPIPELGTATGFEFQLQDNSYQGHDALLAARNQLLGMAAKNPALIGVRPEGLEDTAQLVIDIDRAKARALGVAIADINDTLSIALGSGYANDFIRAGRVQKVIVQAADHARMMPQDILDLWVRNQDGKMLPLSTFTQ